MSEERYLTVTALTKYISYKLDTDVALKSVYIKGEISNARVSKGHLYFVLKDEESEISAIIFNNVCSKLTFMPKDGMKVLIYGNVNSYYRKGSYNLLVSKIEEYGQGLIYQKFLELKDKLDKKGLFSPEHKKAIPEYSERIGVITSFTGDALQDVLSTITRRFPLVHVFIYPALVQGSDAPTSLIKAINQANYDNFVDVIIVCRGGGSIEDLNCFNDEELAYTIYNSMIPIVSGVGHENDYTICDFVSDDRAPTPTGAAVRVTKDKNIIIENINGLTNKLKYSMNKCFNDFCNTYNQLINNYYFKSFDKVLDNKQKDLETIHHKLISLSPINTIDKKIQEVINLEKRIHLYDLPQKIEDKLVNLEKINTDLGKYFLSKIQNLENEFAGNLDKLILVNPLNIMKKGYTLVYKDNKIISSSNDINKNDSLDLHFYDGIRKVKVE